MDVNSAPSLPQKKVTQLGAGALGRPRGMVWGGRREEGSGWVLKFVRNILNYFFLKRKKKKEGDPRLTGPLEQSLEHWVSQGG